MANEINMYLTSKIHNCPNCTATSDNFISLNPNNNYYDVRCCKCNMDYKLMLKYFSCDINPLVIDFIENSNLTLKELAMKNNIPSIDIMAFFKKPNYYNVNMYKFASVVLGIELNELTSFILVDEETYENKKRKILKIC